MRSQWICIGLVAGLLCACKDGGDADGGADESSSGGEDTTTSTTMPMTSSTTDPGGCVPGNEDCECLDGTECVGDMQCIEGICKPGPEFDPQDDEPMVIAGLYVPIQVDVNADEYSWSQVDGPMTEILGDGASILVPVPPDAQAGDVITLRITAVRNTIEATLDYHITVIDAVFENFLGGITDPMQLGTSVGIDFDDNGNMWVSSSEGFLSRFSGDATFLSSYDLAGGPAGMRIGRIYDPAIDDDVPAIYAALSMDQSIVAMNLDSQQMSTLTTEIDGGMALGPVDLVLPDNNGDAIFSNGTQILAYDDDYDGMGTPSTRVLSDMAFTSPITAMSFGPDANVIYVGTQGKVWRVGVLQDGTATEPTVYLDTGDEADPLEAVVGITFDRGGNMFVGVPGTQTLYIAPYVGDAATATVRSFVAPGAGFDAFHSLHHGSDAFSRSALYWTTAADHTIGRLETGLSAD
jgi:hypothetical protein